MYFRKRKTKTSLREVTAFIHYIAGLHGIEEDAIKSAAFDCAGILAAQYFLLSNVKGEGHISDELRDSYVFGYVAGSVADTCETNNFVSGGIAHDLCWIMVTHRVFAETLREAAAMVEQCRWNLSETDLQYHFGYEDALRDLVDARASDAPHEGKLAVHLRRRCKITGSH